MININRQVRLAFQRALFQSINPSLRGIAFEINEAKKFVMIYFYNDGVLTPALEDHYSCIDNEASADFICDDYLYDHDFKVERVDYSKLT